MNILFFLTPKDEVEYVFDYNSLRQAMEKMEYHKYSAVPIITNSGKYYGTLQDGDILWAIKDFKMNEKQLEMVKVSDIKLSRDNKSVSINTDINDLIEKTINQNFVPVVDDNGIFIGIVKRQSIIKYCYDKLKNTI